MENNDPNTDYHKLARVGTKSKKLQKLQSESLFFFFCLRFVFTIFYTGSFQVPPEKKSPPPEVPIPTQNPNLT